MDGFSENLVSKNIFIPSKCVRGYASLFEIHVYLFKLGFAGCTAYAFLCYFLRLTDVFLIASIAIFRYLITCLPSEGSQITCTTSYKVITCVYLVALIWTLIPILGIGTYDVEPLGLDCAVNGSSRDNGKLNLFFRLI